jgi:hypothetical protein
MKCSAFSKLKYEGFSGTEQQKIYNCSQTFYISVVNVFNMSYTLASMTFNAVYKTRQKKEGMKIKYQAFNTFALHLG